MVSKFFIKSCKQIQKQSSWSSASVQRDLPAFYALRAKKLEGELFQTGKMIYTLEYMSYMR